MNSKQKASFFTAKNIAMLAVLLALVVVLQLTLGSVKILTVEFSVVLIHIAVGAMLLGPAAGALLGFAFGLITLIQGITGISQFTNILFTAHPFITSLICIVKGTAAGLVSGLLYKLLCNKNQYLAVGVAAAIAPIVNTGLFVIGAFTMAETMSALAGDTSLVYFIFIGCAGINFLVEFAVNLVVSPALYTVVRVVSKNFSK